MDNVKDSIYYQDESNLPSPEQIYATQLFIKVAQRFLNSAGKEDTITPDRHVYVFIPRTQIVCRITLDETYGLPHNAQYNASGLFIKGYYEKDGKIYCYSGFQSPRHPDAVNHETVAHLIGIGASSMSQLASDLSAGYVMDGSVFTSMQERYKVQLTLGSPLWVNPY